MKPPRPTSAGFTLIELIGVLAVMAVLAAVVTPSALRSIDRAAISAEQQTMANLAAQVPICLRDTGAAPTSANWTTALAAYANGNPTSLATNGRHVGRVYLADPASNPPLRVMILSSMRSTLVLPSSRNIGTASAFDQIWQTADGSVPPASSWAGWSRWTMANAGDYLVIQRINLQPVYSSDLQNLTLTLNNRGTGAASYNFVLADGTVLAPVDVAAGATAVLANQHPRMRLNLYRSAGGATLDYSYVLSSSGKTFDFNGTDWIPQ